MIDSKNWLRYMLACLAVYRMSSLASSEEGPYLPFLYKSEQQIGIFKWIRTKAGAYEYGEDGLPITAWGRGISCPLCTGVYISFVLLIFLYRPILISDLILTWLGMNGLQVLLENATSDDAIKGAIEQVAESIDEDEN